MDLYSSKMVAEHFERLSAVDPVKGRYCAYMSLMLQDRYEDVEKFENLDEFSPLFDELDANYFSNLPKGLKGLMQLTYPKDERYEDVCTALFY